MLNIVYVLLCLSSQVQSQPSSDSNIEYQNHYEVLQIESSSSTSDIKKAYRKLAVAWHPDKHKGEDEKEEATKIFQAIGRAYEVLSDEEKRQTFDEDLQMGNIGENNQYRDHRDRGNIWEQMRRDRLRKQQARKNSFGGKVNDMLTYIIPLFLAFGAYRAYTSSENGTSGNGNNDTQPNNSAPPSTSSSDPSAPPPTPKSTHSSNALQQAPSLVQLSTLHFNISTFLVIFTVRTADEDVTIPWEKLNTLAKARRGERKLTFAWVDLDIEKEFQEKLLKLYPNVINSSINDWNVLALRPTKNKVTHFMNTNDATNFETLGNWIDGLTDGSTGLKKVLD